MNVLENKLYDCYSILSTILTSLQSDLIIVNDSSDPVRIFGNPHENVRKARLGTAGAETIIFLYLVLRFEELSDSPRYSY